MKDADYFAANPDEFYQLTDDQKDSVVNGGTIDDQGDTDPAAADEETSATPEPGQEAIKDPEPELLAKDGKHTIPYQELVDARDKAAQLEQKASQWEQFAAQQAELIAALQAAKVDDAGTGDTKAQEAVMEAYQGDFPEVAEDMKPFIQRMIDDGIKQGLAAFQQQINEQIQPVQKIVQESAQDKHFNAIANAHADWQQVVSDPKLEAWINSHPSFVRDQYNTVLDRGNANQVVELITAYKDANPAKVEAEPEANAKDKAKEVLANVKKPTPNSLSDIPAGTAGTTDVSEAMLTMTPRQLESLFANKSPEEIQKLMSRVV